MEALLIAIFIVIYFMSSIGAMNYFISRNKEPNILRMFLCFIPIFNTMLALLAIKNFNINWRNQFKF